MDGTATVNGAVVAEAEVMCKLADKAEESPSVLDACRSIRLRSSIRGPH